MVFLNSALLAFLGALGLPVLVHLLTLRRRRAHALSTLRFLKEIENTRLKRVRLTRWLLLLVRVLFLLALILAFARPVLDAGAAFLPGAREPLSLLLLLDDSASSRLPSAAGRSVWESGRELALERLQGLEPRDRVWLLPLSDPGQSAGPLTPAAARQRLARWNPAWSAARLDAALEAALGILERDAPSRPQLLLLSDLRLEPTELGGRLPRTLTPLLGILPSRAAGAAPLKLELRSGLLRQDRPVSLTVELAGEGASEGLGLELAVEGETRLSRPVPAHGEERWRGREELEFRLPESGWLRGTLRVTGDPVDVDDELPFILHVPQRRRVLLLAGDPALEHVLAAALLPDERYGRGLELLRGGSELLRRVDPAAVDQLVLALGQPLDAQELRQVRELAARGVRLLLLPALAADPRLVDRQLRELALPGLAGLRESGAQPWRLERLDRGHEILASILEEGEAGEAVPVRRLLELETADPPGLARRTLAEAGGRPVLQTLERETGRTLWLATAPGAEWSGLAASGLLAPLLQQGLRWLDADERLPAVLECGVPGRWQPPRSARGRDWTLVRDGVVRRVRLDPLKGWLELPALAEPGHYEVQVDGRPAGWVAARLPAGETTHEVTPVARWTRPEAGGWRVLRESEVRGGGDAAAELSPWLLLAALLLLGVETWLARGRN
ncbi:MAG: BatA domain-containing protein [Candidatus Delongbacteria bacterium]